MTPQQDKSQPSKLAEGTLREFALFLARTAPEVCALTGLERDHVEAYRHWLAGRPMGRSGQ